MKTNTAIAKACSLLLLVCVLADAQSRSRTTTRRSRPSTPRPMRKLIETVTTPNGREIQLYDNLTYKVIVSVPRSQAAVEVRIKAEMITKEGAVKAVARTQFKVFRDDIKPLLSTITDREGKPMDIFSFYIYRRALEKLKPTILATFTTDSEGYGVVQVPHNDKPSYIYGRFSVGGSSCVWYIELTPKENASFVLDNSNSALCE